MKITLRNIGIIVVAMIIGLIMLACPPEPGGNGNTSSGGFLTAGVWANGTISDPEDSVKYTFNAVAGEVYRIWTNDRTTGDGTKTLVTASNTVTFENGAEGTNILGYIAVTKAGTIGVEIKPSSSSIFNTGTFAVAYTIGETSSRPAYSPLNPSNTTELALNTWMDGEIANQGDFIWYSFNAENTQQYWIWWNDGFETNGNGTKTADVAVSCFYGNDATSVGFSNFDSGWNTARTFTANRTGKVFIRVSIASKASEGQRTGTFGLLYNTANAKANTFNLASAVPLASGIWATGEFTESVNELFYSIEIPTSKTYYFWLNDAQGNGNRTLDATITAVTSAETVIFNSADASWGSPRTSYRTAGETIYLRIVPKTSGQTGLFDIAYNDSAFKPWLEPLNTDVLVNGVWFDDEIVSGSRTEVWYKFNASASGVYRIWWNDGVGSSGNGTKSLDVYVSCFYSDGTPIFEGINAAYSTPRNFTPDSDDVIYISARAVNAGGVGTFGIVFTEGNSTRPPLGIIPSNPSIAIPITLNQWTEGEITGSDTEVWYSFTASSGTHHFWWNDSFVGDDSKTLDITVSVFRASNEDAVFYKMDSAWGSSRSQSLNSGLHYILVTPKTVGATGTFAVSFNNGATKPFIAPVNTTPLTHEQWFDGEITGSSNGEEWYTIDVTGGQSYNFWLNSAAGVFKTLNAGITVYNSNGTVASAHSSGAWSTPRTITPASSGTVYIRVNATEPDTVGTFGIVYSTGNTKPVPPMPAATSITAEQWTTGNIALNGEQWFSFTATAATQYIHCIWGSLSDIYIQLYTSDLNTTGNQSNLYGNSSNRNTNRSLTVGQLYYIRAWPYSSSGNGNFQITINASATAPAQ
ncbi:MAG: hypothetical protein FWC01_04820 [Treponema sp.]|nr:hypothetical protein [Treponema sp.]MCL2237267.1 hypothetical protein [Treponema sp.]